MDINTFRSSHPHAIDNPLYFNPARSSLSKIIFFSQKDYGDIANFERCDTFNKYLRQITESIKAIASRVDRHDSIEPKIDRLITMLMPAQLPDNLKECCYGDLKKIIHFFDNLAKWACSSYTPLLLKFVECLDQEIDNIIAQTFFLYLEYLHLSKKGLFTIIYHEKNKMIEHVLISHAKNQPENRAQHESLIACKIQMIGTPWETEISESDHVYSKNMIKEARVVKSSILQDMKQHVTVNNITHSVIIKIHQKLHQLNNAILIKNNPMRINIFKKKLLNIYINDRLSGLAPADFFIADTSSGLYHAKSQVDICVAIAEKLADDDNIQCLFKVEPITAMGVILVKSIGHFFWLEDTQKGIKYLPSLELFAKLNLAGPLPDAMVISAIKQAGATSTKVLLRSHWVDDYHCVLANITHPSMLFAAIKLLDNNKAIINKRFNRGLTVLMAAILNAKPPETLVCTANPDIVANIKNDKERAALHLAAEMQQTALALLTKSGIDVNIKNDEGCAALHLAVNMQLPLIIEKLLDNPRCNVNIANNDQQTALHFAVVKNRLDQVKQLLARSDINVNATDIIKNTALHLAVLIGSGAIVKELMKKGDLQVNLRDRQGWSPLHMAIIKGEQSIACLFIQNDNVDVNLMTFDRGHNALSLAIKHQRMDVFHKLAAHASININAADRESNTPLIHAVLHGNNVVLDELLQFTHLDLTHKNQANRTARDVALLLKNAEIVKKIDNASHGQSAPPPPNRASRPDYLNYDNAVMIWWQRRAGINKQK